MPERPPESPRRPRVLVLADSANPEWSSASLVGWSLTRALRERAEVHLVTHARNREGLEHAGWVEGRDFTALDPSAVEGPVTRVGEGIRRVTRLGWTWTTAFSTLAYYWFEALAWRRFGEEIRARRWDVVHRITPVSPAVPSTLAARCRRAGVPFVLGPVNGGVPWPREFREAMRREGEWLSYVRGARKLLPGYRSTRSAAAALLAGSSYVWEDLAPYRARTVYLPENAIDPERFRGVTRPRPGGPLRIVFVGRLVPLKGVDMLIEAAVPLLRSGAASLDVVGDGPEMPALRARIAAADVGPAVSLPGWIDQREVIQRIARADVLGFPSIREFGGGVVLEAMALGVVPVVVDHGGPRELLSDETGVRVPLGPRAEIVAGLARVLESLAGDRPRVAAMGERGRHRVESLFTWEVKAAQVAEVYRWVLGERDRPDFGMPLSESAALRPAATTPVPGGHSARPSPGASP